MYLVIAELDICKRFEDTFDTQPINSYGYIMELKRREHSPLGKHHCMAGLQFYKVALDCFTKYK